MTINERVHRWTADASALVYSAAAGAVTISTCGDERDVLLFVFSEKTNGAPTVVSISDTAGLAWQRRQQYQFDASNKGDIEVWWAHAPTKLTGDVVTVTLSASTHNSVIAVVGIANAASGLFDPNAGLPAAGSGSTSPGAVTIDIDAGGENIAFGFWGSATSTLPGQGGGFTKLRGQTNSGGVGYGSILLEGAHFGAGQDALTLETSVTGAVVWGMIADAVAAPDANPPIALSADLVEDAGFEAAITILIPPLELGAAFADDAALVPTIGIWPPLHLAAAFGEDAAFVAAITVLPAPLHLAADLAEGAAVAVYLTTGIAALRLAADFADDAVLTARATLLAALALSVAFTDGAELAAPATIGFQPHAPPIQVVVVLSW